MVRHGLPGTNLGDEGPLSRLVENDSDPVRRFARAVLTGFDVPGAAAVLTGSELGIIGLSAVGCSAAPECEENATS